MRYPIIYSNNPSVEETKALWQGISSHAKQVRGHETGRTFGFFLKDTAGKIIGGCSGFMFYGCLTVDLLWVEEALRGQGYGTELMTAAEKLAAQEKCRFIVVNTMDFEALDFYKQLGYLVEFERHGFDKESIFYFLRKNLLI